MASCWRRCPWAELAAGGAICRRSRRNRRERSVRRRSTRDNDHFSRAPRPVARLALTVALEQRSRPARGAPPIRERARRAPSAARAPRPESRRGSRHGFEARDPARARQRPGFKQVAHCFRVTRRRARRKIAVIPLRRHPTQIIARWRHFTAACATPGRSPRDFMPGVATVSRRWEVQGSMARSRAPRRGFRDSQRSRETPAISSAAALATAPMGSSWAHPLGRDRADPWRKPRGGSRGLAPGGAPKPGRRLPRLPHLARPCPRTLARENSRG
jgi:hypothetical protein